MELKIIIVTLLLIMVGVNLVQLFNNLFVVRRNYLSFGRENDSLRLRIVQLQDELEITRATLEKVASTNLDSGYAITATGIKVLPKGWDKGLSS